MKFIYISLTLIFMFGFNACNKSETPVTPPDPVGTLKVRGIVQLNQQPVQGALVSIDGVLNWRSTSSTDGSFEISAVSNGSHVITAVKTLDNGKIVSQSLSIVTENEINDIGAIDLPQPILMHDIEQGQVTPTSVPLSWMKSINSGFVEYKLYRRDNPGLDETTGELIFRSSELNDTVFTDVDFRTGRTYYYRIYAYSENGKLSGSNLVSVTTHEINLVLNPDFEITSNGTLPDDWALRLSGTPEFDYFKVSSENVRSGSNSLKVTYIDSLANPDPGYSPWGGLSQTISTTNLKKGQNYTISFWTRSEIGNMQVRLVKNGDFEQPIFSFIIPNNQLWTEHKIDFIIDAETTYLELWVNTRSGFAVNGIVRGWIDDIKILK